MIKVKNMQSSNGNSIPNQFIITETGNGTYFQSYDSIIAKKISGRIELDATYWDYSRTTAKYLRQFLGEGIVETRKKIASGEYILVNLNK